MEKEELSSLQLDALREVGNIGAGHAATALSGLLNRPVDMAVPEARLVPIFDLAELYGAAESLICAVLIRAEGDFSCNLVFMMEEDKSQELADLLVGSFCCDDEEMLYQLRDSALSEVGNIVLGAFVNSLSAFTGFSLPVSVPAIAHDMLGALLDVVVAIYGISGDMALMVQTSLSVKGLDGELSGQILMVPDPGKLPILLGKLGVL
ncbi:MAG: chemotaxis protein CheC [Synergistaceae bacterium]|jgi:chemotaxis protein CheC|nr:chemotaxis protein CheC [Synergistaceae bacterium]